MIRQKFDFSYSTEAGTSDFTHSTHVWKRDRAIMTLALCLFHVSLILGCVFCTEYYYTLFDVGF
jgi:hypothetical protein